MTPAEYMREIVIPTVREFRDDPRSQRRAYLACIVTYHLRDYLEKAGEEEGSVGKTMHLLGRDTSWDVVHSICNASKHCGHDPNRPHKISFAPGQDYDRPPAKHGEAVFGLSRWGDGVGGREIPVDGDGLDIYECVRAVLGKYTFHFEHHLGAVDLSEL
jgi:hypothetical protein